MILHTVNASPFRSLSLQDCLLRLNKDDKLLLLGDAVIAVAASTERNQALTILAKQGRLYVLEDDLMARGLTATLGHVINYAAFVKLTINCQSQLAW